MASEAENKQEVKQPEVKSAPLTNPKNLKKAFEATYTVKELIDAAQNLGTSKIVVRAALTKAGKDEYTMKEATNLIERMKNKEVRA